MMNEAGKVHAVDKSDTNLFSYAFLINVLSIIIGMNHSHISLKVNHKMLVRLDILDVPGYCPRSLFGGGYQVQLEHEGKKLYARPYKEK